MNGLDLFRKLGSGAKFDFRKYGADAQRLKVFGFKFLVTFAVVSQLSQICFYICCHDC